MVHFTKKTSFSLFFFFISLKVTIKNKSFANRFPYVSITSYFETLTAWCLLTTVEFFVNKNLYEFNLLAPGMSSGSGGVG